MAGVATRQSNIRTSTTCEINLITVLFLTLQPQPPFPEKGNLTGDAWIAGQAQNNQALLTNWD